MAWRRHKIWLSAAFLTALLFSAAGYLLPDEGGLKAPQAIVVMAEKLPLNPESPDAATVGSLRFKGAWALSGNHDRFGGWSSLVLEDDGHRMVAISDKGNWLVAALDLSSASPLQDATLYPYTRAEGSDALKKREADAESLLRAPKGGYLVGLEQDHRIVAFSAPGGDVAASPYDDGIDFSGVPSNGGVEAMTWLADGRLLAFIERGRDTQNRLPAWIAGPDRADRLYFRAPDNFAPTDAATLPGGDVLVLTRYFSPIDGVAAKLIRVSAADIRPGATIVGTELMTLSPPMTVDNMEGLDILPQPDGSALLVLISDDNFNTLQRTVLMVFELPAEQAHLR